MLRFAPLLLVTAALAAPAQAQSWSWQRMGQGPGPDLRYVLTMTGDPVRSEVVALVGDRANGVWTWVWDGSRWISHATQRLTWYPMAAVYDPVRQRVVQVATDDANFDQVEIYEWDGSAWSHPAPVLRPPNRHSAAVAFDPNRGSVILFGGYNQNSNAYFGDTWEWDGSVWRLLAPVSAPSARAAHQRAVTDPVRSRIVLYGGTGSPRPGVLEDTWEWDGATWQPRFVNTASRGAIRMVYDPLRRRVVSRANSVLWEYDGARWSSLPVRPGSAAPSVGPLAFDPVLGEVILVETGAREFWRLTSAPVPGSVVAYGSTCAAGVDLTTTAVPMLAQPFPVRVANVPGSSQLVALTFGLSDQQWQTFPLPFGLGWAGMPGCFLYHDLAGGSAPMVLGGGVASLSVPIPGDLSLFGFVFRLQALLQDPSTNAAGWCTTNALRCQIGG